MCKLLSIFSILLFFGATSFAQNVVTDQLKLQYEQALPNMDKFVTLEEFNRTESRSLNRLNNDAAVVEEGKNRNKKVKSETKLEE